MGQPEYQIAPARSESDIEAVRALFEAYADWLGLDLMYQGFAGELAGLPGKYAPPRGELLLARDAQGSAVGCVGLRPLDAEGCCEMKRLYVAPEARGHGLGRALVSAVISEATRIGYRELMLDSLPKLAQATALYERMGFRPIPPYYDTPVVATLFFSKRLGS
ncbi:MAG TPA: GNAT family N-acetyltransferase [Hyphomicrobium sp.]|nr:GNAT family N-acetyltransferase [Hyphomicrobium sp.]HRO49618.1 GNAT family N-acetyltransferase [Hyphomicrobium sp.]